MFAFQAECMGTGFTFQIEDESAEAQLRGHCQAAMEVLEDANQRFSLYRPDSEISLLNRGETSWDKASFQQKNILEDVKKWKEKTSGFFDAREGTEDYDPSGLVKAWATQNAADYLLANGVRGFTINAGGDIVLSDDLGSERLNRVGLSNLRPVADADAGANLILDLANTPFRAVATSGVTERGEHIWREDGDNEFVQVSVVGKSIIDADIWATALISGGRIAWEVFKETASDELSAIVTTRDGEIFSSRGFTRLLAKH